ncbi:MAG: hypothetical protein ACJAZP_000739 [Psychromonas sp.]|jgi:hypothetical protein|uniref:tetratricopeptide repeat protein n=1 Tax=Psychromonas sp. TaxID=1884585 RepID=UPI0039E43D24
MHFLSLSIFLICFNSSVYADIQNTSAAPQIITAEQVELPQNKQPAIQNQISAIEKIALPMSEKSTELNTELNIELSAEKSTDSAINLQQQLDKLKVDIETINAQNSAINQGDSLQFRQSIRILDKDIVIDNSLLAILIALLSLLVAFVAYISALNAKNKAIKNAKKSAETHSLMWLEEQEPEIINRLIEKTESLHINSMQKTLGLLDERVFTAQKTAADLGRLSDLYQSLTDQYENDIRFRLTQFDQTSDPDDIKKFEITLNNRLMHKEKIDYSAADSFDQAIVLFHQKDYLVSISFLDKVINNPNSSDLLLTNALFNKAHTLQTCQRTEEAITVYDEIIIRITADDPLELQQQVSKSFFQKGFLLKQLNQVEQEIAVYDQIIARFSDSTGLFFEVEINRALIHKALALCTKDSTTEVLAIFDDLVSRLGERPEIEMQQIVAQALVNKSDYLDKVGQQKQSITGYESVYTRFADSADPQLQNLVTQSLGKMLTIFDLQEKPLAVIELCDKIQIRFARSNELIFKQLLARALQDKAMILLKFNKAKDAIKLFDKIIGRFDKSSSSFLKEKVKDALTYAAQVSLLCEEIESTKDRIQQAEKANLKSSLNFTVLTFVRFLIDEATVETFIDNAEQLSADTKFDRSFTTLKNFIKRLPQVKQIQANAVVDFFETHHDINKLKQLIIH